MGSREQFEAEAAALILKCEEGPIEDYIATVAKALESAHALGVAQGREEAARACEGLHRDNAKVSYLRCARAIREGGGK